METYFEESSQMIRDNWSESFFSKAVLNLEDSTLTIDNRVIPLSYEIQLSSDEVILSVEVLEALGVQVELDSGSIRLGINGVSVQAEYAQTNMAFNSNSWNSQSAQSFVYDTKMISETLLTELCTIHS